jgi:hypothetical protein
LRVDATGFEKEKSEWSRAYFDYRSVEYFLSISVILSRVVSGTSSYRDRYTDAF